MGSYCSTARHTRVVWPIVIKSENNGPFSEDTLERSPEIDELDGKPNYASRKRSSADWESKTPVRSYGKIENSSNSIQTNIKSPCKAIDLDMIKEDGGNQSKLNSGDSSPINEELEWKRGPMIDGSNPVAELYECLDLKLGDRLAVKKFTTEPLEKIEDTDLERVREYVTNEMEPIVARLQEIEHENLLRYYGIKMKQLKEPRPNIITDVVMEFASGGSIAALVEKFETLDERIIRKYTQQILEGLSYLHSQGIVHGNLKSSNVLIDSNGVVKLSDVDRITGIKSMIEPPPEGYRIPNVPADSVYWTAPEVFITNKIDISSDVWSVGCIVYEMLTGSPPYGIMPAYDAYEMLISGEEISLPEDIEVSENCLDFLEKAFKLNPKARPSSYDMIEHCFIYDKNHDNSSVLESLQTLQSVSIVKGHSANLQNDLSSNELLQRTSIVLNRTRSPEKNPRRESQDKRESALRQSALSRVFETNTEEETSPIERRDRFGNKVVQKGRYFNEDKNAINNNNNTKQPSVTTNNKIKKSRTADLHPVNEAIDQEENIEEKGIIRTEEMTIMNDEREGKIPHTPIRSSVFKTLKSCEPEFVLENDVSEEVEVMTPKWETMNKSPEQLKEEQRRKFEEELMRQLEDAQEMASQDQSYDKNASLYSREIEQQDQEQDQGDTTEPLDPEEQRRKIEAEIMKQLTMIKSKDLGAGTGLESAPFSESARSTMILPRSKTGTKELGLTMGAESVPFSDSKNNSTVMKLESIHDQIFERDERRKKTDPKITSNQFGGNQNLLPTFLQTPDETRSVIKLESINNSIELKYGDNSNKRSGLNNISLPFSESKSRQESMIQVKESEAPQLTAEEKRRLFEEDILKQLQRIHTEELSFSQNVSGMSLSKSPSRMDNPGESPQGGDFGDDLPKFKIFKKELDELEK